MLKRQRLVLVLLVWAVVGLVSSLARADDWQLVEEHWYVVELAGHKAGWMTSSIHSDGERYRSDSQVRLSFGRGPATTTIEFDSSFVESHQGEPVSLKFRQKMGRQPVQTLWEFAADHVVQTTEQAGRETVTELPLPEGDWLTPMAMGRYWLQQQQSGAQEMTYRIIDPANGLSPMAVTHRFVAEEVMQRDGQTVAVTVWRTTTEKPPLTATEKYDPQGTLMYQAVTAGFEMITRIATKAEALARPGQQPELLVATFIKPNQPIAGSRRTTTATLRLRTKKGAMPPLPSAGAQRVEVGDDAGSVILHVDINENQRAPADEAQNPAYLQASAVIDSKDEQIHQLAARATDKAGDDLYKKAEAMRSFVHRYISNKDLNTAFATASEVARLKSGDCSEHAVLLCAMLRTQEIPARIAVGLIYAESFLQQRGVFGWHMWTQALIDGKWVDFDATLRNRYHAAHVLTSTSDLADGAFSQQMAGALQLIGNLEIDVVEVGYERLGATSRP